MGNYQVIDFQMTAASKYINTHRKTLFNDRRLKLASYPRDTKGYNFVLN